MIWRYLSHQLHEKKKTFNVMFVETNHSQEQKETKGVRLEPLVIKRYCAS